MTEPLPTEQIYEDLGGVPEVAAALGVKIHRVKRWIERRETTHCPNPVRVLSNMKLYSIAEWKGWFALWRLTRERKRASSS